MMDWDNCSRSRPRESVLRLIGLGMVNGLVLFRTRNFCLPLDVLRLRLASLDLLFGLSVPEVASTRSALLLLLPNVAFFLRWLEAPTFLDSELKYLIVVPVDDY